MSKFLPLLLLLFFSHTSNACETKMLAAESFINQYIGLDNDMDARGWLGSSKLVTESFLTAYDKILNDAKINDPELGLGYDPVVVAQDVPNKYVAARCEDNMVYLEGENAPQFTLVISFQRNKQQWLVNSAGHVIGKPR